MIWPAGAVTAARQVEVLVEHLIGLVFWAVLTLSGLAMLALYFGWWPFGISF